jgi:hypothetical protein
MYKVTMMEHTLVYCLSEVPSQTRFMKRQHRAWYVISQHGNGIQSLNISSFLLFLLLASNKNMVVKVIYINF